ncbi:sensor histidine kinase [Paenibacillus sp. IB182496]|uniref:Sensor histidine kinase n=1 Tax=Paenibacillus sabuli TaxID=2772509 RepID=A0A927GSH7_9BACL|nr:sensor histidine kinase [Paenibacillus sabuli]MBD2846301.1 sensor histidine kinase [Paenibacillus sabuli]
MGHKLRLLWAAYRKIVYVYLLLVLLPACALLYVYFHKASAELERQVAESMLRAVEQVRINVDYRLSIVLEVSDSLILNELLYDNLAEPASGYRFDQVMEQRNLASLIKSLKGHDILGIKLYVPDDKLYAREHVHFFGLSEARAQPWYGDVMARSGAAYWVSTRPQLYGAAGEVQALSLARLIRDPQRFERVIGIMEILVPETNYAPILSGAEFADDAEAMYILDRAGRIVSHSGASRIGERLLPQPQFAEMTSGRSGILRFAHRGEPYLAIYDTLQQNGWKTVSFVPARAISRPDWATSFASPLVLILSFLLLFILAAFLVFAYVTDGMVARLRQITSRLRLRGAETVGERIANRRGVILRLEQSVAHMLTTHEQLVADHYETRMKEREAQLRALQAQINPHFLYNALDTINWMALTRGASDISRMLNTLAQYFRLTLSKGRDLVTVEDELNLARAYLDIQQHRFDNFTFELELDPAVRECRIPKLTVQPLVENAVLHGIQRKEGHTGRLLVHAYASGAGYAIRVRDDGAGMPAEQAERLTSGLQGAPGPAPAGYGLYNVMERLRIYTHGRCRMQLDSAPDVGTTVTIFVDRLPER